MKNNRVSYQGSGIRWEAKGVPNVSLSYASLSNAIKTFTTPYGVNY